MDVLVVRDAQAVAAGAAELFLEATAGAASLRGIARDSPAADPVGQAALLLHRRSRGSPFAPRVQLRPRAAGTVLPGADPRHPGAPAARGGQRPRRGSAALRFRRPGDRGRTAPLRSAPARPRTRRPPLLAL